MKRLSIAACFIVAFAFILSGCSSDDCLPGSVKSGKTCVNLQEDQANCGKIGTACDAGQVCSKGACTATCATGLDSCDGSCRDLQIDHENCGACGTVCSTTKTCASGSCQAWVTVAANSTGEGFADFIPAGKKPLVATGTDVYSYNVAGDSWATDFSTLTLPGGYAYPAYDGAKLYWLAAGSVTKYTIATGAFTTTAVASMPTSNDAQNTADDNHNVYMIADNSKIVQYNTSTGAMHTFTGATGIVPGNGSETRAAWDSKTAKLYFGDYDDLPFYSFDPADGTLTKLAPAPTPMNDAFCSDRKGHIYTSTSSGDQSVFWTFDTASGTWKYGYIPFSVGSSGSCTVSGDGYLFFLEGSGATYKLKVF